MTELRTARTILRPFVPGDAEAAFAWFGDEEVMRFHPTGPDTSVGATRERLATYVAHRERHGFSKWLVLSREDGRPIGDAGLMRLASTGEVELGYRLARREWGRGLATEIARALIRHARDHLGLERIIAFTHPDNTASLRVIERLGMSFHLDTDVAELLPGMASQPARVFALRLQRDRPAFIVSTREVPEEAGRYRGSDENLAFGRAIGAAAGLRRIGLHVERLPPGHRASLPHAHEREEEFVYVLEGELDAWIDGALHRMVAGDLAAFPAGTGIAHTLQNNGDRDALFLCGGEKSDGSDRLVYPVDPWRMESLSAHRRWGDAPRRRKGAWPGRPVAAGERVQVLETERLALRWWRLDDDEAMFAIFRDPALYEHLRSKPHTSIDQVRAWLGREVDAAPRRGFGHWAVIEKASGAIVGSCGFRAGFTPDELEVGFNIARPSQGRGYATEIATACVRHGLEAMGTARILSLTSPANAPARRVLEKSGLALRGIEEHDGATWCVYQTGG